VSGANPNPCPRQRYLDAYQLLAPKSPDRATLPVATPPTPRRVGSGRTSLPDPSSHGPSISRRCGSREEDASIPPALSPVSGLSTRASPDLIQPPEHPPRPVRAGPRAERAAHAIKRDCTAPGPVVNLQAWQDLCLDIYCSPPCADGTRAPDHLDSPRFSRTRGGPSPTQNAGRAVQYLNARSSRHASRREGCLQASAVAARPRLSPLVEVAAVSRGRSPYERPARRERLRCGKRRA